MLTTIFTIVAAVIVAATLAYIIRLRVLLALEKEEHAVTRMLLVAARKEIKELRVSLKESHRHIGTGVTLTPEESWK